MDESFGGEGFGVKVMMIGSNSEEFQYSLRFEFLATKNDSEYETVITGLVLVARLGVCSVEIYSDSQLIVG